MTTIPTYKPSRLGFGEHAPKEASQAHGRTLFLRAVQRHVPAVLTALAGEPLACYRAAVADAGQHGAHRAALMAWGREWHLDADWRLELAMDTLRMWASQLPDSLLLREWAYPTVAYFLPTSVEDRLFTFTHRGWEPSSDFTTRVEAERGIRQAFEAQLHSYLDDMETRAEATGMERTPEKRSPEHVDWLARYQVEGLSFTALAKALEADRQTVTEGVKQVATFIDLPLRASSKPGRPANMT